MFSRHQTCQIWLGPHPSFDRDWSRFFLVMGESDPTCSTLQEAVKEAEALVRPGWRRFHKNMDSVCFLYLVNFIILVQVFC